MNCDSTMHMNSGEMIYHCQKPAGHGGPHEWSNLALGPGYLNDVRLTWKPNEAASVS